jgi:hypothetical protein
LPAEGPMQLAGSATTHVGEGARVGTGALASLPLSEAEGSMRPRCIGPQRVRDGLEERRFTARAKRFVSGYSSKAVPQSRRNRGRAALKRRVSDKIDAGFSPRRISAPPIPTPCHLATTKVLCISSHTRVKRNPTVRGPRQRRGLFLQVTVPLTSDSRHHQAFVILRRALLARRRTHVTRRQRHNSCGEGARVGTGSLASLP